MWFNSNTWVDWITQPIRKMKLRLLLNASSSVQSLRTVFEWFKFTLTRADFSSKFYVSFTSSYFVIQSKFFRIPCKHVRALRQLQEKCREQRQPLYLAFINLTKAFDLVSHDGLLKILGKIGCPSRLLNMIQSFHCNMKGVVQFDGQSSDPFDIWRGVKQGCLLAPALFGIFFAVALMHAFGHSTEGIFLHSTSDGKLFSFSHLKAKTKLRKVLIRDFLFADDAAVAIHSGRDSKSSRILLLSMRNIHFKLTISIKKTNIMAQAVDWTPTIIINGQELDVVYEFTYSWIHHVGQPLYGQRSEQENRTCSIHFWKAFKESLGEQQADNSHQNADLQSLCAQHSAVWERGINFPLKPRKKAEYHPHALSSAYPWD